MAAPWPVSRKASSLSWLKSLNDSQTYVQFRLELKRRSLFDPSRRVDGAGTLDEETGQCST